MYTESDDFSKKVWGPHWGGIVNPKILFNLKNIVDFKYKVLYI